jgi:hypothetical protein
MKPKLTFLLSLLLLSLGFIGTASADLLVFGGVGHDEFLGCFDCSKYDSGSICNKYGTYGSKYNSNSLWNKYGTYGSKYSSSSPWNKYSSGNDVPVLVDKSGNFYGYLTINCYRENAFKSCRSWKDAYERLDDLDKLRDAHCSSQ